MGVDTARLARDQRWFLTIFIFKVALGLVAFALKPWLGLLFFAAYGVYFWRQGVGKVVMRWPGGGSGGGYRGGDVVTRRRCWCDRRGDAG